MASSGRFHGVTVTLVDTGARTIALPSSSIIGLCDTFTVMPTVGSDGSLVGQPRCRYTSSSAASNRGSSTEASSPADDADGASIR